MFLSRLKINRRARNVQRDLADPYEMHRTLSRAWPQGDDYQRARVLFRIDETRDGGTIVIVQSQTAPDWSRLPEGYCLEDPQMKEWNPALTRGQALAFRLYANPTVKQGGKRRGLYREHEQLQWLQRKAASCGFALPQQEMDVNGEALVLPAVRVQPRGSAMREKRADGKVVHFTRVQANLRRNEEPQPPEVETHGNGPAVFSAACFDGVLRITDEEAFLRALQSGIGSGKGLGFGLLSVARV